MPLVFTHNVIETPLDTLNILGAGGLREGTLTEVYGPNASGKSSFVYDVGSRFQKKYPNGEVVIIDVETSIDYVRMKHTFDYDLDRVHPRPAASLEDGFATITDICQGRFDFESGREGKVARKAASDVAKMGVNEYKRFFRGFEVEPSWPADRTDENKQADIETLIARGVVIDDRNSKVPPTLVIWDSIAGSKPRLEVEAAITGEEKTMNAGGMGLRARVMEQQLAICNAQIYSAPVTVLILNQVRTTGFGTYPGPTDHNSSGGNALKHFVHYRLYFEKIKTVMDEELRSSRGTKSKVAIEKSKFSPTAHSIFIYIDDTLGGRIRHVEEIQLLAKQLGVIGSSGRWHYWAHEWEPGGKIPKVEGAKSFDFADLRENEEARRRCIELVTHHFRIAYLSVDWLYREAGITTGEPTEEERQRWHSPRPVPENVESETGDILV